MTTNPSLSKISFETIERRNLEFIIELQTKYEGK